MQHAGSYSDQGSNTMPPAVGVQSLNHWTTREVPYLTFKNVPSPLEYKLFEGRDLSLSSICCKPPLGIYLTDIPKTSSLCRNEMGRNVCP